MASNVDELSQTKNLQTFDLQANDFGQTKGAPVFGWDSVSWLKHRRLGGCVWYEGFHQGAYEFLFGERERQICMVNLEEPCTKSQKSLRDFWQTHSFFPQNMDPLRVWGPKVASQIALFGTNFLRSSAVFGGSLVSHEPGHGWDGRNLGRFFEKILEVFQVLFFFNPSKKNKWNDFSKNFGSKVWAIRQEGLLLLIFI